MIMFFIASILCADDKRLPNGKPSAHYGASAADDLTN